MITVSKYPNDVAASYTYTFRNPSIKVLIQIKLNRCSNCQLAIASQTTAQRAAFKNLDRLTQGVK